jgi:hypothetical protein
MIPDMQPVVSSWVAAIGYDVQAQEVYVEVIDGGIYVYGPVPRPVWRDFETADGKSTFVNEVLKPGYPYRKA